jgi:hypothetical protein
MVMGVLWGSGGGGGLTCGFWVVFEGGLGDLFLVGSGKEVHAIGSHVFATGRQGQERETAGSLAALGMTISFRNCQRKASARAKAKEEADSRRE